MKSTRKNNRLSVEEKPNAVVTHANAVGIAVSSKALHTAKLIESCEVFDTIESQLPNPSVRRRAAQSFQVLDESRQVFRFQSRSSCLRAPALDKGFSCRTCFIARANPSSSSSSTNRSNVGKSRMTLLTRPSPSVTNSEAKGNLRFKEAAALFMREALHFQPLVATAKALAGQRSGHPL